MRKILRYLSLTILFSLLVSSWAQAETELIESYGAQLCQKPGYRCIAVKPGQTWAELFPNVMVRNIIMRLNRTSVALAYRRWLIVPKNMQNLDYLQFAPFPQHRDTHGRRLLLVNLAKFAFAAYDSQGQLIFWGPATGGRTRCEHNDESCATATGSFRIYRMKGEACESSTFPVATQGGAEMPYCMFYFKGFAIHGSTMGGFVNRSHGCVRLFYSDAKWLNEHFVKIGTRVVVVR